jgi:hypothetical protein
MGNFLSLSAQAHTAWSGHALVTLPYAADAGFWTPTATSPGSTWVTGDVTELAPLWAWTGLDVTPQGAPSILLSSWAGEGPIVGFTVGIGVSKATVSAGAPVTASLFIRRTSLGGNAWTMGTPPTFFGPDKGWSVAVRDTDNSLLDITWNGNENRPVAAPTALWLTVRLAAGSDAVDAPVEFTLVDSAGAPSPAMGLQFVKVSARTRIGGPGPLVGPASLTQTRQAALCTNTPPPSPRCLQPVRLTWPVPDLMPTAADTWRVTVYNVGPAGPTTVAVDAATGTPPSLVTNPSVDVCTTCASGVAAVVFNPPLPFGPAPQ